MYRGSRPRAGLNFDTCARESHCNMTVTVPHIAHVHVVYTTGITHAYARGRSQNLEFEKSTRSSEALQIELKLFKSMQHALSGLSLALCRSTEDEKGHIPILKNIYHNH